MPKVQSWWESDVPLVGRNLLSKRSDFAAISYHFPSIERSEAENRIAVWIGDVVFGLNACYSRREIIPDVLWRISAGAYLLGMFDSANLIASIERTDPISFL